MRGSERFAERERESKTDNAVFEWLGARARARARAANAERVPAGMCCLIADSGVILFVSGVSNLIMVVGVSEATSDCIAVRYSNWSTLLPSSE